MKDALTTDITVYQEPVSVSFLCPYCEEETELEIKEALDEWGLPPDWEYTKIKCPKCGKKIEIDSVDWQ